jgi:hypothetical protein
MVVQSVVAAAERAFPILMSSGVVRRPLGTRFRRACSPHPLPTHRTARMMPLPSVGPHGVVQADRGVKRPHG